MSEVPSTNQNETVYVYAQKSYNIFGQQLAAIRHSKNMSLRAMGNILGMKPQQISAYEQGVTTPRMDRIIMIATKLELPIKVIIGDEQAVIQSDGTYQYKVLSEEAYKVACAFLEASEKYQKVVKYALDIPLE